MLATTVPEASTSAHLALAEGLSSPKSWIVTRLHESWTASQAELLHATHPALLATNRALVRIAIRYTEDMAAVVPRPWPPRILAIGIEAPPLVMALRVRVDPPCLGVSTTRRRRIIATDVLGRSFLL